MTSHLDVYLKDNQQAIQQRFADWQMKTRELDQVDRIQRMSKVESELQRESLWYKIGHIFIGLVLGVGATTMYFNYPFNLSNPAPVVQNGQG